MTNAMATGSKRARADLFTYLGVEVRETELLARYDLDGVRFQERVSFAGIGSLKRDAVLPVATLWASLAGLSYYKAGAARRVDLGPLALTPAGRALFDQALRDGLAEFAFRNDLDLSDVAISGGVDAAPRSDRHDPTRVLIPFGGGIDSIVTVESLAPDLDRRLFVVSPSSGTFDPLERAAAVTELDIVRATRTLDPQILQRRDGWFNGHVPVTAMVTLLATVAALADGRGGVVMSNEHSASVPNLVHRGRDVNHQWSKSWVAEQLTAAAVREAVGETMTVQSFLRDRSELWVAERFSHVSQYHYVFRSCNRAFAQSVSDRAVNWCGECDKCLFIHLMLAVFMDRERLAMVMGTEPLSDVRRRDQLLTLVGLGHSRKPFECVGDPEECAVALRAVSQNPRWRDDTLVAEIAPLISPDESLAQMLAQRGVSGAPAAWFR